MNHSKEQTPVTAPSEQPIRPFPTETLYDLLVGDLALVRGQYNTGLEYYLRQARETGDSAVIEIANRAANHVRNREATEETAQLWIAVDPDNPKARKAALQASALRGNTLEALPHAYWLYQNHDDVDAFLSVTAINEGKKEEQIPALIAVYQALELDEDKSPMVDMAVAQLYRESGKLEQAENAAKRLIAEQPDNLRGLLLLAQLFHQQQRTTEATALLSDALERLPESRALRMQYARFLIQTDNSKAIHQFEYLYQKNQQDYEASFILGLLLLDQRNTTAAIQYLKNASASPVFRSDAHYHLGTIAELEGDSTEAIIHYRRVRSGRNFLSAATRIADLISHGGDTASAGMYLQKLRSEYPAQSAALFQVESNLLIRKNQSEEALNTLSTGLALHPNDIQLLYARSMLAENQNRFDLAEQDLRSILAQDANNATALNALGYGMLVHTDRYGEASELIARAYQIRPNDPAIIDSMGWALFHLGDLQQALEHLKKAMAILPDPEIAAHLGEVQWLLGNRNAALQSWQKGLAQDPEHRSIIETMQRLGADPATLTPDKVE